MTMRAIVTFTALVFLVGCPRTPEEEKQATDWYYAQRKLDVGTVKSVEVVTETAHGGSRYTGPIMQQRIHVRFDDGRLAVYAMSHHVSEIQVGTKVEILYKKSDLEITKVTVQK